MKPLKGGGIFPNKNMTISYALGYFKQRRRLNFILQIYIKQNQTITTLARHNHFG
jgi:hypothetical protein